MTDRTTIKVFAKAPHIEEEDIFGKKINLSDYKDKKVFIGFYRHAGCPFCNVRVHRLLKQRDYYKSMGLEMILFFESSKETLLKSKFHKKLNQIPAISDPDKKIYASYGVEHSVLKSSLSHIKSFFQIVVKAKTNKLPTHWMVENESFNTIPAEFLIDENGFVKRIHYFKNLSDQMSDDVINEFLA